MPQSKAVVQLQNYVKYVPQISYPKGWADSLSNPVMAFAIIPQSKLDLKSKAFPEILTAAINQISYLFLYGHLVETFLR